MTNEKALELLKENKERRVAPIYIACKNLAIKALEKQIPKKPLQSCGHATDKTMNYCPVCGQALDWSDTE